MGIVRFVLYAVAIATGFAVILSSFASLGVGWWLAIGQHGPQGSWWVLPAACLLIIPAMGVVYALLIGFFSLVDVVEGETTPRDYTVGLWRIAAWLNPIGIWLFCGKCLWGLLKRGWDGLLEEGIDTLLGAGTAPKPELAAAATQQKPRPTPPTRPSEPKK
jgi:hypothetical protein